MAAIPFYTSAEDGFTAATRKPRDKTGSDVSYLNESGNVYLHNNDIKKTFVNKPRDPNKPSIFPLDKNTNGDKICLLDSGWLIFDVWRIARLRRVLPWAASALFPEKAFKMEKVYLYPLSIEKLISRCDCLFLAK